MPAPVAYLARWPDYTIKFRLLTFREVQTALQLDVPQASRDAWVYEKAILEGPALDQVPAGIMCWVGYFLVDQSPFTGQAELIQTHTKLARQVFGQSWMEHARALLAGTFRYTFEEVDTWDQETFFSRLAAAEYLTGGPKFEAQTEADREAPQSVANPYEQQAVWRKEQQKQKKEFLQKRTNARRN